MPLLTQSHDKNIDKKEFTCDNCGKKYVPNAKKLWDCINKPPKNKFCSKECYFDFRKIKDEVICDNCGEKYIPTAGQIYNYKHQRAKNKFCSRECSDKFKIINKPLELICINCGRNYIEYDKNKLCEIINKSSTYTICSNECKNKYSDFLRMRNNQRKRLKRREKINNVPLTEEEQEMVDMIYKKARYLTEVTGISYNIDHIIPISSGYATNHPYNLQIITAWANNIKGCSIPNLDTLSGIHEEQRNYLKSLIKPKNGKTKSN